METIKITEDFLSEAVKDVLKEFVCFGVNENYIEEQMVDEALIHSYNADVVIRHITSTFNIANGLKDYIFGGVKNDGFAYVKRGSNGCDLLILAIKNDKKELLRQITLSLEKSCGWFMSRKVNLNVQGIDGWTFEKKFDNDATVDTEKRRFLYHLAPSSRLEKILHVGLVPKRTTWDIFKIDDEHTFSDSQGTHYGWKTIDRVYAFLDRPSDEFINRNNFNGGKDIFTDTYALLRIDLSELQAGTKFYYDPRSEGAVYTLSNIPAKAITIV